MNKEQLIELLNELVKQPHESEYVEFKLNFHSAEEIGERISALSNGACIKDQPSGYLVFGVEDKTQRIKGTTFKAKIAKKGNESLEHWLLTRLNPRIDFTVYEFDYDANRHIAIYIIPATKNQPVEFLHQAYIRVGSITRKLNEFPYKQAKIWKKDTIPFEKEIAKDNLGISDITKFLSTESYFDLLKLPYPSNQQGVIDKFMDEGLVDWINSQLPANEEIGKALRKETRMYPEIAIRELVANALIHQDLTEKGFPMVEIFSDRIEISNSGKPLVPPDRFIDAYLSHNEKLGLAISTLV